MPADAVAAVLDLGLNLEVSAESWTVRSVNLLRACCAVVVDFAHFSRGDTGSTIQPGELIADGGVLGPGIPSGDSAL